MSFSPYRRRRKNGPVDISAAMAKPYDPVPGPLMYPRDFPMGWSESSEKTVEPQRKKAVELCDVPEQPMSRYHTDIMYDDRAAGVIWFSGGAWRVMIGPFEFGRFKTYLGARKFVYRWFSALDIVPWDEQ